MSDDDNLYFCTVEFPVERGELLRITGARETVLEAALRVMLDCAPAWDKYQGMRPLFSINCTKVKR